MASSCMRFELRPSPDTKGTQMESDMADRRKGAGSGVLSRNQKREKPSPARVLKGEATIEGRRSRVAAWVKERTARSSSQWASAPPTCRQNQSRQASTSRSTTRSPSEDRRRDEHGRRHGTRRHGAGRGAVCHRLCGTLRMPKGSLTPLALAKERRRAARSLEWGRIAEAHPTRAPVRAKFSRHLQLPHACEGNLS